jgi:Ser/Thr protein kinase RdoA (MazF antagonist)
MSLVCGEDEREVKEFQAGPDAIGDLGQLVSTLYGLPRGSIASLVSRSENETHRIEAPSGQRWALRLQRPGYQSIQSLASEIAWLVALREDGVVATPVPVAGSNGEYIQSAGDRNMALFVWENGRHPELGMDLRGCFRSLGSITAQMHRHSRKWVKPAGFERFVWNFETALGDAPRWGDWRAAPGVNSSLLDLFARATELIRTRLEAYGSGPDRFGLAHCDQRLANLLIDGSDLKVIDFDDCGFSWYMYDAATPLSFYEHRAEAAGLIDHWLEGYQSVASLSCAEIEEIPTFVMLRRLLLVAWIGSRPDADLARSLGASFTEQTGPLCRGYLDGLG